MRDHLVAGEPEFLLECLRTSRFLHRTLIVLSLIGLALAFSFDQGDRYSRALGELEAINSLDIDGEFVAYVKKSAEAALTKHFETLTSIAETSSVDLGEKVEIDRVTHFSAGKALELAHHHSIGRDIPHGALHEIRPRLLADENATVFLPDADAWAAGISAAMNAVPWDGAVAREIRVGNAGSPSSGFHVPEGGIRIFLRFSAPGAQATARTPFVDRSVIDHYQEYRRDGIPMLDVALHVGGKLEELEGVNFPQFLASQSAYRQLTTGKPPRVSIPGLDQIWPEVRDQTIEQAIRLLETRTATGSATISVFNIPVDPRIISIGGPTALLALLVYLLGHLQHLRGIDGAGTLIRRFPWMPLFDGRISIGTSVCTLAALPVAAQLALTVATWERGWPQRAFCLLALVSTVIVSVLAIREMARVRTTAN